MNPHRQLLDELIDLLAMGSFAWEQHRDDIAATCHNLAKQLFAIRCPLCTNALSRFASAANGGHIFNLDEVPAGLRPALNKPWLS